jgi:hypothetical protein
MFAQMSADDIAESENYFKQQNCVIAIEHKRRRVQAITKTQEKDNTKCRKTAKLLKDKMINYLTRIHRKERTGTRCQCPGELFVAEK